MREKLSESLSKKAEVIASTSGMLLEVVRSLTSRPDCVAMRILDEGGTSVMVITVAALDLPRVLGKDGRTARSLRAIAWSIGRRSRQRLEVDVLGAEEGCC